MKYWEEVEISPVFSLFYFEHFLAKDTKRIAETIEKRLRFMRGACRWEPEIVSVEKPPPRLAGVNGKIATERFATFYHQVGKVALPFPYLLGCLEQAPDLLFRALRQAHSIEAIEYEGWATFLRPPLYKHLHQLCIRLSGGGLRIMLSDYIWDGHIRADERTSDQSVRFLTAIKEKQFEGEYGT